MLDQTKGKASKAAVFINDSEKKGLMAIFRGHLPERQFRLPRIWSNQCLRKIAPLFSGEIINVSGWDDRDKEGGHYQNYFNANGYYLSNFTGERGMEDAGKVTDYVIDLVRLPPSDLVGRFDVVFNHTTLEHIFDVEKAFHTLCALSRDVVIIVVPFAQAEHFTASYGDYWRFTPMGMRELFQRQGLEVIFEAANQDQNAGNYLFFVGSKNPNRWISKMPPYQSIADMGNWIGTPKSFFLANARQFLAGFMKSLYRRYLQLRHVK